MRERESNCAGTLGQGNEPGPACGNEMGRGWNSKSRKFVLCYSGFLRCGVLFCLACLLACAPEKCPESANFFGLHLGMTEAEVQKARPGFVKTIDEHGSLVMRGPITKPDDVPDSVTFLGDPKQTTVGKIIFSFDPQKLSYSSVKDQVSKILGMPPEKWEEPNPCKNVCFWDIRSNSTFVAYADSKPIYGVKLIERAIENRSHIILLIAYYDC